MTLDELKKLHEDIINKETDILLTKGKEYCITEDRLKFFKDYASKLNITPEKVCAIFMLKHFNSIISYVNSGKNLSDENIESRILDARNYLLLLLAINKDNDVDNDKNICYNNDRELHYVDEDGNYINDCEANF